MTGETNLRSIVDRGPLQDAVLATDCVVKLLQHSFEPDEPSAVALMDMTHVSPSARSLARSMVKAIESMAGQRVELLGTKTLRKYAALLDHLVISRMEREEPETSDVELKQLTGSYPIERVLDRHSRL